jgi:tripartite-type tricarboxylate transporter receptor subunit TctC
MTRSRLPLTLGFLLAALPASADDVEDFYRGRTLTVMVGVGAGGEYDLQMRMVSRHIAKHIPGKPATVAQNMVGATGLLMANHLANVAPKDGSVIGLVQNGLPSYQAMGIEGVNFDATKFNWIGSLSPTAETMAIFKHAGVRTIEDARKKELIAGSNGRSGITYTFPRLMNELLGTRFKIITGYQGVNEINIAMDRGEADGRNNSWTSWKASKPDWVANKDIHIIVYAGPKPRDLEGVPAFEDLVANEEDRQLVRLVISGSRLGHPFATAPGVPQERVKALRDAFAAMVRDPDYLKEITAARLEPNPIRGEDLQKTVDELMAMPQAIRARGKKLVE